jgi:hypothetical protein
MNEFLIFILFMAGFFFLQGWLLPKLGIDT